VCSLTAGRGVGCATLCRSTGTGIRRSAAAGRRPRKRRRPLVAATTATPSAPLVPTHTALPPRRRPTQAPAPQPERIRGVERLAAVPQIAKLHLPVRAPGHHQVPHVSGLQQNRHHAVGVRLGVEKKSVSLESASVGVLYGQTGHVSCVQSAKQSDRASNSVCRIWERPGGRTCTTDSNRAGVRKSKLITAPSSAPAMSKAPCAVKHVPGDCV
jgi:hypothetical protein